MDLTTYTNAELDQLRLDVLNEQERRKRLVTIPATITTLADQYVVSGGDRADLSNAVTDTSRDAELTQSSQRSTTNVS